MNKLEIFALPHIIEILREENMDDAGDEHVNDNKDNKRPELAGPPEQGEELESEEARAARAIPGSEARSASMPVASGPPKVEVRGRVSTSDQLC